MKTSIGYILYFVPIALNFFLENILVIKIVVDVEFQAENFRSVEISS